jgi:hypothetical protein
MSRPSQPVEICGRFARVCAAIHFSHSFSGTPARPGQISVPL